MRLFLTFKPIITMKACKAKKKQKFDSTFFVFLMKTEIHLRIEYMTYTHKISLLCRQSLWHRQFCQFSKRFDGPFGACNRGWIMWVERKEMVHQKKKKKKQTKIMPWALSTRITYEKYLVCLFYLLLIIMHLVEKGIKHSDKAKRKLVSISETKSIPIILYTLSLVAFYIRCFHVLHKNE
jgi:hypothetical protein